MDYKEIYEQALERARTFYKRWNGIDADNSALVINEVKEIFPELKESKDEDDEKIRKMIINHLTQERGSLSNDEAAEAIDWLEKQCEKNPYSGTSFKYEGHTWGMCARDNGVEIIFDGELKAFLSSDKSFIYPIHPQKSLAPKSAIEALKEERVDNQNCGNSADEVEPKFHEGDWITNGEYTWKIVEVKPLDYILQSQDGNIVDDTIYFVDRHFRLWTIQDAKDGDVLSFNDGHGNDCIELIKSITDKKIEFWFCLTNGNNFEVFNGINPYTNLASREDSTPATKEQRELLFSKTKEVGYEWDAEKNALKKIVDEEQIKKNLQDNSFRRMFEKKEFKKIESNLDDLIEESYQQQADDLIDMVAEKPKWSEEDEHRVKDTIYFLETAKKHYASTVELDACIDWLKSIKNRLTR